MRELGFIGCNLNPDPSGGHWTSPPLTDRHWYPFYEAMVELDVPAMVHVSASCNPNFHATGAHYINADTTAFMQFIEGDLFRDFPTLRFIIPHGGGAVPYHWGRYRGLADMLKRPPLEEHVMRNVFFDTCVYHQPGIDLLVRVIDIGNILFGSEMVGAVRGIDPQTGHYFDDTRRYIDALSIPAADKERIFESNARRVFPRLDALLQGAGTVSAAAEHPARGCAVARERGLRALHDGRGLAAVSSQRRGARASCRRRARWTPTVTCSVPARAFPTPRSASTRPATRRRPSCGACGTTSDSTATSSCRPPVTAPTTAPWSMRC